jgi:hypothetical protein
MGGWPYQNWQRVLEIDTLWEFVGNGKQQVRVYMADFQVWWLSTDMVYDIMFVYYKKSFPVHDERIN